ncbi:winged helix-turn-helix domain-containing protein [Vibrio mediterranei]|uniref:OmpR/PhoB-type domain-containing protein n=1 Tax=Vibrio mediterranei TaxID=689 RepID=A0A3G4VBT2_9VIBR|nr:winged helix-turn-helix domain-containing protein [Vibrio mediterranei]AYV21022.1 hypothetical protein ECB94_06715 [Vibrio mediterranei]
MTNILDQALKLKCDINIGELCYNPYQKVLKNSSDEVITIDQRSLEVLEILLSNVGTPIDSETMLCKIWKNQFISKNVVTNRVCFLRGIVRENDTNIDARELLKTYPKKGYYLSPNYVELCLEKPMTDIDIGDDSSVRSININYLALLSAIIILFVFILLI